MPEQQPTHIVLGAKLTSAEAAVFQQWCKARNLSPNEVLKYVIECILKMQHDDSINNDKLVEAMQVFEGFKDIHKVGSIIMPQQELEVLEAIYFVYEHDKTGITAVLVEPSFFDEPRYSTDKNEILDEVLTTCNRSLSHRLRLIGKRLDTQTIIETVTALAEYYEHNEDEDSEFIRELFSDNSRHEWGGKHDDEIFYQQRRKQSIKEDSPIQTSFIEQLTEVSNEPKDDEETPGSAFRTTPTEDA